MSFLINPYIYAAPTSSFPSGAVVAWKLDGNSNDSTANSNNGTDTSITYNSGNGIIIQGAGFNGSTSKIAINDSPSLSVTSDLTINMWVKAAAQPSGSAYWGLVCKGVVNSYIVLYRDNAGTKQFENYIFADNTVTNFSKQVYNQTLTTGTWFMVTFVAVPGNTIATKLKLYINGSAVSTTNSNVGTGASSIYNGTEPLNLGFRQTTEFFNGAMDEVTVWNRELTIGEISTLYNSGAGIQYS